MRPINYLAAATILCFFAFPVLAQDELGGVTGYAQTWGPNVGQPLPFLTAVDQTGVEQTLDSLSGAQGLLLFLNRSADWWPFCRHQFVQLEENRKEFEKLGVNVAGMTYDRREVLSAFHNKENLGYPLLQDVDAQHVNAYNIRNLDYAQGHRAYGIPHPGIIFVDANGVVKAKYAVPGYRKRPPFDQLLEDVSKLANN